MTPRGTTPGVVPRLEITRPPDLGDPARTGRPILQQWLDSAGRLVAAGGRDGGTCWMHWPGLGTFFFDATGPVRATPVSDGLDDRLSDAFIRGVLPVVLLGRGFHAFHASAVADDAGVAVICAASGTGKSTLAIALAARGLEPWADDTVVYTRAADEALAWRLPFRPRVADAPVSAAAPVGLTADVRPVRRIYLLSRDPSLDPERPRVTRVDPRERFSKLLAHAHPVDVHGPECHRSFIEAVMHVASRVDTCELRFAPSLASLPRLCDAVLNEPWAR